MVDIVAQRGQERGDRHDPSMTALAIGDEQPAFTQRIPKGAGRGLRNAATRPAASHRSLPDPDRWPGRDELDDVVVIEDPEEMPDRANERDHPPITRHRGAHRHAALHRVVVEFPERDQMRTEPGDRRQPPSDRRHANPSDESIGITVASADPVRWTRMNSNT